jgi:hypothetical protein
MIYAILFFLSLFRGWSHINMEEKAVVVGGLTTSGGSLESHAC